MGKKVKISLAVQASKLYAINFSIHPPKKGAVKSGLSIDPKLKINPDPVETTY